MLRGVGPRRYGEAQGAPTEGAGAGEVAADGGVVPGGVVVGVGRAEGRAVREPAGGGVWGRGPGVDGGAGLVGEVAVGAVVSGGVVVGAVGVAEG